jgi:hypothetical protein
MNFFLRVLRDEANQCVGPVLPSRKGAGRRTLLLGNPDFSIPAAFDCCCAGPFLLRGTIFDAVRK